MSRADADIARIFLTLRRDCGERADDVLALTLIGMGDPLLGGSSVVTRLLARAARHAKDAKADEAAQLADYFRDHPLPASLVSRFTDELRGWSARQRTAQPSPAARKLLGLA